MFTILLKLIKLLNHGLTEEVCH